MDLILSLTLAQTRFHIVVLTDIFNFVNELMYMYEKIIASDRTAYLSFIRHKSYQIGCKLDVFILSWFNIKIDFKDVKLV
jgi:hypothetical protein